MTQKTGWLRPYASTLGLVFRSVDAALIVASHALAATLVDRSFGVAELAASAIAILVFQGVADRRGLYMGFRGHPLRSELWQLLMAWLVVPPVLLLVAFTLKISSDYSRLASLTWFALVPIGLTIFRFALRSGLAELRLRGRNTRTAAILGMTALGEHIAREITSSPWLGLRLVGFYDDRQEDRCHPVPDGLGKHLGDLDELVETARKGKVDVVYLALPMRAEVRLQAIVRELSDTTASVYMAADFDAFDLLHARWTALGEVPVVSIHETPFHGIDGWVKRLEDIVIGGLIVSMIALPMLAIALAVKLTSKGPIFFRQRRYGLNGEVINVLKFRTMTVSEDGANVKQATKDDARITKVGAFLRRTSLDELPQFLQVLTGDMSIVGPRPHAIVHNELYRSQIHGYMLRHKVKPGITGWAQVNGWRGETDTLDKMEKRVEHDLEYIRNWNLVWDLEIIFRTVFSSASRKNAY